MQNPKTLKLFKNAKKIEKLKNSLEYSWHLSKVKMYFHFDPTSPLAEIYFIDIIIKAYIIIENYVALLTVKI